MQPGKIAEIKNIYEPKSIFRLVIYNKKNRFIVVIKTLRNTKYLYNLISDYILHFSNCETLVS